MPHMKAIRPELDQFDTKDSLARAMHAFHKGKQRG